MSKRFSIITVLVLIAVLFGLSSAQAATLYAKAAGGNWSAAGTWSTTGSGGVDSSGPPTSADDVVLESGSGNVVINAAAACRSIDMTSGTGTYAGTLNHDAAITLSIGDGTAGAGNVALKFAAGTYTVDSQTTSAISFVSTSATQQDVAFAATNTTGPITFSGAGSSYRFTDQHTTGGQTVVSITAGTVDTNNQTISWGSMSSSGATTRTLSLGSSAVTLTGVSNTQIVIFSGSNFTFNAGTSTITWSGTASTRVAAGGKTFNVLALNGSGTANVDGGTYATLTRTGTAGKVEALTLSGNITVTGTLNLNGNSASNRLLVSSNSPGSTRTITNTGATMSWTNVDFQDITLTTAYDASAITGLSGNCAGNTNITFTSGQTQYWVGGSGNWSTAAEWGTSSGGAGGRVPLCQDDVIFDDNSFDNTGQTVTVDMPRVGKSVDWSAYSEGQTPTWSSTTTSLSIFGSITLISGMTFTQTSSLTVGHRSGTATFTTAGKTFGQMTLYTPGGTVVLAGNLIAGAFSVQMGTFDANDYDVTVTSFNSSSSATRTVSMGAGTWTVTGTGATMWNMASSAALTFNAETSTIVISDTSATSKTFAGGGKTFNNLTITGGGAGQVIFTGSNTFNTFTINAPKTVHFTAGTTNTVSSFVATGSAGNLITISSPTAATHTLSDASGWNDCDYVDISYSIVSGGAKWSARTHSVNSGNNTGWVFRGKLVTVN